MSTKRRILLVDDEVTVLLTLKAVLEISGFDVQTATSAREGKSRIKHHEYDMVITDMRMENESAGAEVVHAARVAPYHPAVALLTAFPVDEMEWDEAAPDKVLVKATQTRVLLQQVDKLLATRAQKLSRLAERAQQLPERGKGEAVANGDLSLAAAASSPKKPAGTPRRTAEDVATAEA